MDYTSKVVSYSDYYPFGMQMPGRNGSTSEYRYGFNGMEKDDEMKGASNSYDFGARMYDPRVGRFLSLDPKAADYPWMSPYCFADNSPLWQEDFNGEGPNKKVKPKPKTWAKIVPVSANWVISEINRQGGLVKQQGGKMNPSASIVKMIVSYEKLSLTMYDLDGDPNGNATIGFGHKIHDDAIDGRSSEAPYKNGITYQEAVELFRKDIINTNKYVNQLVINRGLSGQLSQDEYDVAFDFGYNAGGGLTNKYLKKLKKVKDLENSGKEKKASKAREKLAKWVGKQYPGGDDKRGKSRESTFRGEGSPEKEQILPEVVVKG